MKRFFGIICIIVILIPYFFIPKLEVSGKTLGDLKAELEEAKKNLLNNENEKILTQEQINTAKQNIIDINNTIAEINEQIAQLIQEIEELNIQINEKDEEIKKIVNFLQISNGEAAYLEYTFGAKDFTDFIYRAAVSEQLAAYNDRLIDEYNELIVSKEQTQEQLNTEKTNLNAKHKELEAQIELLGNKYRELEEDAISIEDLIQTQEDVIKMYEVDLGCKDDEDLKTCGKQALPPDTKFWRPLTYGYISSNYGWRTYYLGGWISDFHGGIDIGVEGGTPIYPTANGVVASVTWYSSCGGNYLYIHHYVNGSYYTSSYMHMRNIYVSPGDTVTKDTVIGTVGGNPYTEYWDSCSTGSHLDFKLYYGRAGYDYPIYGSEFYSNRMDPRVLVNFPDLYNSFYDRITRY